MLRPQDHQRLSKWSSNPSPLRSKQLLFMLSVGIHERLHLWETKESVAQTWCKPLPWVISLLLSTSNKFSFQNPNNKTQVQWSLCSQSHGSLNILCVTSEQCFSGVWAVASTEHPALPQPHTFPRDIDQVGADGGRRGRGHSKETLFGGDHSPGEQSPPHQSHIQKNPNL